MLLAAATGGRLLAPCTQSLQGTSRAVMLWEAAGPAAHMQQDAPRRAPRVQVKRFCMPRQHQPPVC